MTKQYRNTGISTAPEGTPNSAWLLEEVEEEEQTTQTKQAATTQQQKTSP